MSGWPARKRLKMALKNFYRRLLPAVALCLPLLLLAQSSSSSQYLAVGEPQKVAGKRGASVQSKIPLTVMTGYHVNSNAPNEEYLIPLKLTWTSTGALEPGAVTYPKPLQEKYEFSEKPLSVYTGSFELVANFKVAANAPAGPGVAA